MRKNKKSRKKKNNKHFYLHSILPFPGRNKTK